MIFLQKKQQQKKQSGLRELIQKLKIHGLDYPKKETPYELEQKPMGHADADTSQNHSACPGKQSFDKLLTM